MLRCILISKNEKCCSACSASIWWNTPPKFLFTSWKSRRVIHANKQEDYPCQRGAKELGYHPCQSKDRFYFLFSQQQKSCTLLAASSNCFFHITASIHLAAGLFHWSWDPHSSDSRCWGTEQTGDLRDGLPNFVSVSPIATVSVQFIRSLLDSTELSHLSNSLHCLMVRRESGMSKTQQ